MWESIATWIVDSILGLETSSGWGAALQFFIHDGLKIGFLLLLVTHLMGLVNALFPVSRVRDAISSGRLRGLEHPAASLFGAATPFCSCSSIPLFIGFLQGGIPLGITLSFLITSPLINEVAVALFLGLFGWKVTAVYVGAGLFLGTSLGILLGRVVPREWVEEWVWELAAEGAPAAAGGEGAASLWRRVSGEALGISRNVAPYIAAGLAVGGVIHGFVPAGYFEGWLAEGSLLGVPVAVLVAVPLYANAAGVIPVVETLVTKGIPLGTALAFMMAVVGLSLPEAMILRKVMKIRLLGAFFGTVALSIILLGYGFNILF